MSPSKWRNRAAPASTPVCAFNTMVSNLLSLTLTLLDLLTASLAISSSVSVLNADPTGHPSIRPYHNPIISGFAPDPSYTQVREQFFYVSSSFSAFPGIPVYTSRDLVQWQQIGEVFASRNVCLKVTRPIGYCRKCSIQARTTSYLEYD